MPGMTGITFLKKAAEMRPQTVRIILTGYTDVDTLVESINSGVVYKYVTKPWSNGDLQQTVKRAIEHYETLKQQNRLVQENKRLQLCVKATVRGFVNLAMQMFDLKDPMLHSHVRRTAGYAADIGNALNMNAGELEQLSLAAMLHEVAHIRLPAGMRAPNSILRGEELESMHNYVGEGVKLIADVPALDEVAAIVNFRHEQYDGTGYPNRLVGDDIPLHARILAIADAYDEMREPPTDAPAFGHEDALLVLQSGGGTQYDPLLVSIFCDLDFSNEPQYTSAPVGAELALQI